MEKKNHKTEAIPQETIDSIKRSIDLVEYIQSRGVKLTKSGKEYRGLCVFHNDTKPSFYVNSGKKVWHCMGCNKGGDVIEFVQLMDNLSFPDAVHKLSGNGHVPFLPNEPTITDAIRVQLLTRVFDYYQKTFIKDKRGITYLKSRGIKSTKVFKTIQPGFADGSLSSKLTSDVKEQLQQLGVFTDNGHELMYECVIFPLVDRNGQIVNLYGRHISRNQHLFLKGGWKGLFFPPKGCDAILITEGIIDALTLWHAGYQNALAVYGVNGLTNDHLAYMRKHRIRQATLCLDNDEAGRNAAQEIADRLSSAGVDVQICWVDEGQDVNDFFQLKNKQEFDELLKQSAFYIQKKIASKNGKQTMSQPDKASRDIQKVKCEVIEDGFLCDFGEHRYRVLGMNMNGLDRLKVNVKVMKDNSFHIDSIDLYASRAREPFIKTTARLLKTSEDVLIREINELIDLLETKRLELLQGDKEEAKPDMSAAEKKEAMRFLKSKNLIKQILSDFERCGLIGEDTAKLFGYIATISRFHEKPLGVLIISQSGAGKTILQNKVTDFVPPEDLQKYTRLTGQSLFYKEKAELKYKVLAIGEEKGVEDAIYSIRALQSDQYLNVAVTITDPQTGLKKTEESHVDGPTCIFLTTANATSMDFETRNRFAITTIDESRQQTRRIQDRQREEETLKGHLLKSETDRIQRKHHNAQRLLRNVMVVNNYATELTYSDNQLLMRRDHTRYLTLIKSITYLFQYQRPLKKARNAYNEEFEYIEVTVQDIELANKLASEMFGHSLDELSPHTRSLLKEIKTMVDEWCRKDNKKQSDIRFCRRDICNFTGKTYWQVQEHLQQLVELEYLLLKRGGQDNLYLYELIWNGEGENHEKFMMGLIDANKLKSS